MATPKMIGPKRIAQTGRGLPVRLPPLLLPAVVLQTARASSNPKVSQVSLADFAWPAAATAEEKAEEREKEGAVAAAEYAVAEAFQVSRDDDFALESPGAESRFCFLQHLRDGATP